MKFFRTLALIVSASLLFTACSKEPDDAAVTLKGNINPLLAYVPADTTYVFAGLEPVPAEITDAYVTRFQPVLDVMSEHIIKFQAGYQAGEFQDDQIAKLGMAVLDELGGSLSKENLEKLGISLQAHHAFYGMGVFPVARLGLGDEQKLREALARIEVKMGYALPERTLNGTSYWRVSEDDTPVALYVAILEQHLAFSVFPVNSEDRLLAAFLGQEMPADSIASSNALGIMNADKGYSTYGSGFVDIQKLADEIMNPDSESRSLMGAEANSHLDSLDAVCVAEIKSMIAKAPRMTAGTTRLTSNEVAVRYDLEIESVLASGLAALVSDTPPAGKADHLLSASLAIRVGKLRSFLLEKATAVFESPYQCASMQNLNEQAGQLMTQLNTPMPPMVNNLMGIRARLDDFDADRELIQNSGLLALHVDRPEMFVGMASMMVPGFENLDLANQTEPVRIPAEMTHMEGVDVFALMSDKAIGAAIGEKHVKDLDGFLNEKPQDNGTFLSISHDMGKQMEVQTALAEKYQVDAGDEYGAVSEYAEAVKQAYGEILGQSHVEMRFTPEGLHIDTSLNFK